MKRSTLVLEAFKITKSLLQKRSFRFYKLSQICEFLVQLKQANRKFRSGNLMNRSVIDFDDPGLQNIHSLNS